MYNKKTALNFSPQLSSAASQPKLHVTAANRLSVAYIHVSNQTQHSERADSAVFVVHFQLAAVTCENRIIAAAYTTALPTRHTTVACCSLAYKPQKTLVACSYIVLCDVTLHTLYMYLHVSADAQIHVNSKQS